MSFSAESRTISRESAISVIKDIIASEQNLVENCRYLCRFRNSCDVQDSDIWNPIAGFESETDDYPLGSMRNLYSGSKLKQLDAEVGDYAKELWPVIVRSCERLLAALE